MKDQKAKVSKIKIHNELTYLDFANFNYDTFKSLPEWIQKIMQRSMEMRAMDDEPDPQIDDNWDDSGPNSDKDIPY